MNYNYNTTLKYYSYILIAKFRVIDANGNILFDNTNLDDSLPKITGGKFKKSSQKYSLGYVDTSKRNIATKIKKQKISKNEN